MTAFLLDTCVMIDYLRDRQEAIEFMRRQETRPAVSAVTAAELFAGVRSSAEEHRIETLCGRLLVHHVDPEVARLGGSYCRQYRHSPRRPVGGRAHRRDGPYPPGSSRDTQRQALPDARQRGRTLSAELNGGRADGG
jgi:predicted nucleic acid-binding protein